MQESCKNCCYSDIMIIDLVDPEVFGDEEGRETPHLVCRRFPPTPLNNTENDNVDTVWPLVHDEEWCGEWDKKIGLSIREE